MSLSPGQVLHKRYRIVQSIGQGGFGAVYRAWDLSLKQPCALKENLDTNPEAQRQFEREALLLNGNPEGAAVLATMLFILTLESQVWLYLQRADVRQVFT